MPQSVAIAQLPQKKLYFTQKIKREKGDKLEKITTHREILYSIDLLKARTKKEERKTQKNRKSWERRKVDHPARVTGTD